MSDMNSTLPIKRKRGRPKRADNVTTAHVAQPTKQRKPRRKQLNTLAGRRRIGIQIKDQMKKLDAQELNAVLAFISKVLEYRESRNKLLETGGDATAESPVPNQRPTAGPEPKKETGDSDVEANSSDELSEEAATDSDVDVAQSSDSSSTDSEWGV